MITPIGKRVVVGRLPKRQEGLIHIPDKFDTGPSQIGEVLALGTGGPFEVKIGDHVLLPETYGPGHTEVDGRDVCIISEDNLLGVLVE